MYLRNLGYDPTSKCQRRLRAGNYTGVILPNGVRLPRCSTRHLWISLEDVIMWATFLAKQVEERYIEVTTDTGDVLTVEKIMGLTEQPIVEDEETSVDVDADGVEGVEDDDKTEQESEIAGSETDEALLFTMDDLQALKRSELDDMAKMHGLDPTDYSNKAAVIDAILAAQEG